MIVIESMSACVQIFSSKSSGYTNFMMVHFRKEITPIDFLMGFRCLWYIYTVFIVLP